MPQKGEIDCFQQIQFFFLIWELEFVSYVISSSLQQILFHSPTMNLRNFR